jgi:hypothetical protein
MFKRSYDSGPDGNDAPAADLSTKNSAGCGRRNEVRLVEGEMPIKLDISARRDAGRVRNGDHRSAYRIAPETKGGAPH